VEDIYYGSHHLFAYDRIHLTDTRFEVLKRDAEIKKLKKLIAEDNHSEKTEVIEQAFQNEICQLNEDRQLLHECNQGSEFMAPELQEKVRQISSRNWRNEEGETVPFLSEDEMKNLLIPSGTLTPDERNIINDHIVISLKITPVRLRFLA
jgi:hypothetical protein